MPFPLGRCLNLAPLLLIVPMQSSTEVQGEAMRAVMRRVPSPVVIVTAGAGEPRGATIGSFTSVSLEPPLISFNVAHASQMHRVITHTQRFAVHILSGEHADLYRRFALPELSGEDQFRGVTHQVEEDGLPVLNESSAVIYCRRYAVHPAGDHSIILGEVEAVVDKGAEAPLVYYNRTYRELGRLVLSAAEVTTNLESSETPDTPAPKNA